MVWHHSPFFAQQFAAITQRANPVEAAFVDEILSSQNDDAVLVFADWLEERGDARAEYVRAMRDFAGWLRSLPVPTTEQTVRFADHVANNHSWYKHLPLFPPGASFVFYPNPQAGCGFRKAGDDLVAYEIDQGDYFAHHSRLATAEYVAEFGHWDYWVGNSRATSDARPTAWQYMDDESYPELLADAIRQQWSCQLTAFLRPSPSLFIRRGPEAAVAFLNSNRQSLGGAIRGLVGRQRDTDADRERYRPFAQLLCEGVDSSDASLREFIASEGRAQRELVLDTLNQVRATWVGVH